MVGLTGDLLTHVDAQRIHLFYALSDLLVDIKTRFIHPVVDSIVRYRRVATF